MNDDTNQPAREILSERSGAAYQFDWDMQVVSLVAAEKAITSAREEALREALLEIARRSLTNIEHAPDAYLDGLEDAKDAILSLTNGGGERG